jgi:serine phosphatase RsbU (regulator of sigma subunit)
VEAINNAIIHGCADTPGAVVVIRASWREGALEIQVRDPGRFEPADHWGELPEDPLAEDGRGGFLMKQAFASVEHVNDGDGHTLLLRKNISRPAVTTRTLTPASGPVVEPAPSYEPELRIAHETVSGLRFLVSLLARSTTLYELIRPALGKLHEIDPFSFACVRMVRRAHLELERGHGATPALLQSLSIGEDALETRAILTLGIQRIDNTDTLASEDPLHGTGGPAVVVPVCFEEERIGTLAVVRARGESPFGTGTVALVQTLAEFFGVAWATAQLQARERDLEVTARELTVAAEMQTRLLPEAFPSRGDVRFSGACRSAQAVGGDFYDVFAVEGGTFVVIADAMGKGVPAAFVASVLRCAIRARAHQAGDPGTLLREVNRQIIGDLLAVDIFITALVAFLPAGAREVRVASAGHCPLMVRRASGVVDVIEGTGLPLGVLSETEYTTVPVELAAGDAAVFFTDGLYEVGPAEELHLGLDWLRETVGRTGSRDADDTVVDLLEATKARAGGGPASDDRTLLVCQRVA